MEISLPVTLAVLGAAVIAFAVFKEKMTGQRIAAACAVLAGLVALRI